MVQPSTPSLLFQSVTPSAPTFLQQRCRCRFHISSLRIRVTPLSINPFLRQLPTNRSSSSTTSYQADCTFRPCGFSPLRRFTPQEGRELIASHNQSEVRYVSSTRHPLIRPEPCRWTFREIPRSAFHTLRRIPLDCSRSVSPQPLPS